LVFEEKIIMEILITALGAATIKGLYLERGSLTYAFNDPA
jgi:hypothetical protein